MTIIDTARAATVPDRDSARIADGFGNNLTTNEIELCQYVERGMTVDRQQADLVVTAEQDRQHQRST